MAIERFEQLHVWRVAHELTLMIYRATTDFPSDERFGLVSQMRRAAVSVPANIAEGFKRAGRADKTHFYNIAQASLEELRYYGILSRDLRLPLDHEPVAEKAEQVGRMLTALIRSVRAAVAR